MSRYNTMTPTRKVKNFIEQHKLIRKRDTVLLGVSGGPDSMALLSMLEEIKHDLGINIVVVNVNHQLRKEAGTDQSFVANFCQRRNIPFIAEKITVTPQKSKSSIEELAREKRFSVLIKAAKKVKAQRIALGHHQDDLAETVLMRILRGTGLQGLSGILPYREINGFKFIRPLLSLTRAEIMMYLKEKRLKYRTDLTNKQKHFFRNKVRLHLLPLLQKNYQPNINKLLANLADNIATDYDFLNREAQTHFKKTLIKNNSKTTITLRDNTLIKLHPSMRRMVFRICIDNLKGNTNQITAKHLQEIDNLLMLRPLKSVLNLPQGLFVTKGKSSLVFARKSI